MVAEQDFLSVDIVISLIEWFRDISRQFQYDIIQTWIGCFVQYKLGQNDWIFWIFKWRAFQKLCISSLNILIGLNLLDIASYTYKLHHLSFVLTEDES